MNNNETYLDFCFVRPASGEFTHVIDSLLKDAFKGKPLNWYLEEKVENEAEIVIAEVKGMSSWRSEEETLKFLDQQAGEEFWEYLQGYQMYIYPAKGCGSCATN